MEAIEATGTKVVAISYDPADKIKEFADANKIAFPLLADPDSATIARFGLLNKDGYAYPGTYLIDTSGVVRDALFLDDYKVRHSTDELIQAASKLK